jgi:hypothetical protein
MTLAANAAAIRSNVRPITEPDKVSGVVEKFRAKYGAADVHRYYSKFDVAVEVGLG